MVWQWDVCAGEFTVLGITIVTPIVCVTKWPEWVLLSRSSWNFANPLLNYNNRNWFRTEPCSMLCGDSCGHLTARGSHMFRVEAFATGIKIESWDQSPFGGPIKGSRWPPNCQIKKKAQLQFDLWPLKIKWSRAWEREQSSNQVHFLWLQMLQQATVTTPWSASLLYGICA